MFTVAILTLSDKGSRGEREDKSGPVIAEMLDADLYEVVHTAILPDEKHIIESNLKALCDAIDPRALYQWTYTALGLSRKRYR